jgi:hypothetical protein
MPAADWFHRAQDWHGTFLGVDRRSFCCEVGQRGAGAAVLSKLIHRCLDTE